VSSVNYGVCQKCRERVPATHLIREGKVYLSKACPDCGTTEALVSSNAAIWQHKRELYGFEPGCSMGCALHCKGCAHAHHPRMVFLDMTNRCNMNCPICVANIPSMRFEFHPPRAYFENVFKGLAKMEPKPVVHFFGGEPTMRDDLFELIHMAHRRGLRVHLVTNGVKLADEKYCKKVCKKKVPVLLGFDGRDPEIYNKMRKNPSAYDKKLKALENLKKYSKRRQDIIMCCVARHINDQHIADLIALCHEHRNHIKGLYFLPLTETWEPGRFEADITTTIEDVEEIVDSAFPDEKVEFVSLGLQDHLNRALAFFRAGGKQTFPTVHPNCEAATVLVSDGERYRPLGYYLARPLEEFAKEAIRRARKIDAKLAKLDQDRWFQRLRGRLTVLRALSGLLIKALRFRRITKGSPWLAIPRILGGLLIGRPLGAQLQKHTLLADRLTMIILPFEETHSLESERLVSCAAGFAYEDPDTGEVSTLPACSWWLYNTDILKGITAKYAQ